MKWLITIVLVLLALFIGIVGTYNWMHENEVKLLQQKDKECAEKVAAALKQTKWETLEPGLRVLRVWNAGGPEWPQLAVLELSTEQYKTMKKDPSEFLNQHTIFTKAVKKGALLSEIPPGPSKDYSGLWYTVCAHKPPSDANGAAFDGQLELPPHP